MRIVAIVAHGDIIGKHVHYSISPFIRNGEKQRRTIQRRTRTATKTRTNKKMRIQEARSMGSITVPAIAVTIDIWG
jgi:hypothetical protein